MPLQVYAQFLRHAMCGSYTKGHGLDRREELTEVPPHSDGTGTLNTYSHILPALQEDAAAKMDAILSNRGRLCVS